MNESEKILHEKNTDDFKTMKSMLDDIEIALMQRPPIEQFEFYQPIQTMILYAWQELGGHKQDSINGIINPSK